MASAGGPRSRVAFTLPDEAYVGDEKMAARAMKLAPESIHPGVVAAFEQAAETGLTGREILRPSARRA